MWNKVGLTKCVIKGDSQNVEQSESKKCRAKKDSTNVEQSETQKCRTKVTQ